MLSIEREKSVHGRPCSAPLEPNREAALNSASSSALSLYRKRTRRSSMDGRAVLSSALLPISSKIIAEPGFGSLEKGLEVELSPDLRSAMWKKLIIGM